MQMLDDLLKDAREVAGKQEVDPASADGGSPALRFRLMKFQTWLEMIEELLAKLPVLAAGQGTPRAQATNKMQARFLSHFREQQEAHMERGIFPVSHRPCHHPDDRVACVFNGCHRFSLWQAGPPWDES